MRTRMMSMGDWASNSGEVVSPFSGRGVVVCMSKTTKSRPLRNDHRRPHSFGSVPAQMIQRTVLQYHHGGASVRLSCMSCLIARHVMPTSSALIHSRSWRRGDSVQRPFYTSMRRTLVSGAYTKCKPRCTRYITPVVYANLLVTSSMILLTRQ